MWLDYEKAIELTKKNGIEFVPTFTVKNERELEKALNKLEFPIVMKATGKELIHKTEKNAIRLNISSNPEAIKTFHELKKIKEMEKVVVQEQVKGLELIIGGKTDPQFGETILLGLGGIYTEIFKDFSLRVLPIQEKDAEEMIQELKAYPILAGARGKKGIPLQQLKKMLVQTSRFILKNKISELDFNPVMASEKKIVAVDVRINK